MTEMKLQRNTDFMHENDENMVLHAKCAICGESDLVMSEIILKANYGSRHDGEIKTLYLCSECFDKVYKLFN